MVRRNRKPGGSILNGVWRHQNSGSYSKKKNGAWRTGGTNGRKYDVASLWCCATLTHRAHYPLPRPVPSSPMAVSPSGPPLFTHSQTHTHSTQRTTKTNTCTKSFFLLREHESGAMQSEIRWGLGRELQRSHIHALSSP